MNEIIHKIFNARKRYSFPFDGSKNDIPSNGVYIIFENGEKYKEYDRIVRVGSHNGQNQLYSRLNQYFVR